MPNSDDLGPQLTGREREVADRHGYADRHERAAGWRHDVAKYVAVDWDGLAQLDETARYEVLTWLCERGGELFAAARGRYVDGLRDQHGSDAAVAARLGVSDHSLAHVGHGRMTKDGVQPQVLIAGARILLGISDGPHVVNLGHAIGMLEKPGRPNFGNHLAAAKKIEMAGKELRPGALDRLSPDNAATVRRAIAHATQIVMRNQDGQ